MATKKERKLKEKDNKLPEKQSKGFKARIRKGIFIFLSAIGLTSFGYNVMHELEVDKNVRMESNMDKGKRNNFLKSLKTATSNKEIVDEVIENRR